MYSRGRLAGDPTDMGHQHLRQLDASRERGTQGERDRQLLQYGPWGFRPELPDLCGRRGLHLDIDDPYPADTNGGGASSSNEHPRGLLSMVQQLFAGGSIERQDVGAVRAWLGLRGLSGAMRAVHPGAQE